MKKNGGAEPRPSDDLERALELAVRRPSESLVERTWRSIQADRHAGDTARATQNGRVSGADRPAGRQDWLEPIWSWLTADSLRPSPAMRSAATQPIEAATPRVLVFETPRHTLSITLTPPHDVEAGQPRLRGQLYPKDSEALPQSSATLCLQDPSRSPGRGSSKPAATGPSAALDEIGGFSFERLDGNDCILIEVGEDAFFAGPLPGTF